MRRHGANLRAHAPALAADDQHALFMRAMRVKIRAAKLRRHNGIAAFAHGHQRCRQIVGALGGYAEHRAHGRAQRFGAVQIRTRAGKQRAVKARRIRRTQDGADIAGILHAVHRHDQIAGKRLRLRADGHGRHDALRRLLLAERVHH